MRTAPLSLRLPAEVAEELDRQCAELGHSRHAVALQALRIGLAFPKSPIYPSSFPGSELGPPITDMARHAADIIAARPPKRARIKKAQAPPLENRAQQPQRPAHAIGCSCLMCKPPA